jgi:hypothetical protein
MVSVQFGRIEEKQAQQHNPEKKQYHSGYEKHRTRDQKQMPIAGMSPWETNSALSRAISGRRIDPHTNVQTQIPNHSADALAGR